jgi:hypothetical protein
MIIDHSVRFNLENARSDQERQIMWVFNDKEQQHLASVLLKILDELLAPSQNNIREWRPHLAILIHGKCLCIDIDPPIGKLTYPLARDEIGRRIGSGPQIVP